MKYIIGTIIGITLAASLSLVMAENIGAGSPGSGQDLSKGAIGSGAAQSREPFSGLGPAMPSGNYGYADYSTGPHGGVPDAYIPDSGGAGYKGTNFAMTKAEAINAIKNRITTTGIGSTGSTETWIDPIKLATYLYEHQLP